MTKNIFKAILGIMLIPLCLCLDVFRFFVLKNCYNQHCFGTTRAIFDAVDKNAKNNFNGEI